MDEKWKDIVGFENYQVSDLGRVKSKARIVAFNNGKNNYYTKKEKFLKLDNSAKNGYLRVTIYKNQSNFQSKVIESKLIPLPECFILKMLETEWYVPLLKTSTI